MGDGEGFEPPAEFIFTCALAAVGELVEDWLIESKFDFSRGFKEEPIDEVVVVVEIVLLDVGTNGGGGGGVAGGAIITST